VDCDLFEPLRSAAIIKVTLYKLAVFVEGFLFQQFATKFNRTVEPIEKYGKMPATLRANACGIARECVATVGKLDLRVLRCIWA
jgi:hypothetical protein